MKLIYDPVNDHIKLRALIRLLIKSEKDTIVSGMSCRLLFSRKFGIDIDHHEYAYELDNMTRTHEVTFHDHHGGDTQYRVL